MRTRKRRPRSTSGAGGSFPGQVMPCLSHASAMRCLSQVVPQSCHAPGHASWSHGAPSREQIPCFLFLRWCACACVRTRAGARAFVRVCGRFAFADSLSAAFSSRSRRACRPPPHTRAPHTPPVPPVPRSSLLAAATRAPVAARARARRSGAGLRQRADPPSQPWRPATRRDPRLAGSAGVPARDSRVARRDPRPFAPTRDDRDPFFCHDFIGPRFLA